MGTLEQPMRDLLSRAVQHAIQHVLPALARSQYTQLHDDVVRHVVEAQRMLPHLLQRPQRAYECAESALELCGYLLETLMPIGQPAAAALSSEVLSAAGAMQKELGLLNVKMAEVECRQSRRSGGETFRFINSQLIDAMQRGDWVRASAFVLACSEARFFALVSRRSCWMVSPAARLTSLSA
jgi:hypothetical protein